MSREDAKVRKAAGAKERDENAIATLVVDAAYRIHTTLGPGLLESVYERLLEYELRELGLTVRCEVSLPVEYGALRIEEGYRIDMLVDEKVIVELKSVERTAPVHAKQLLTYLRLADKRLGLLVNFGAATIKEGVTRVVNGLAEPAR
jgi:GxxExxY protein